MTSGTKPTYFVGLEFKTSLDSSLARAALSQEQVRLAQSQNKIRQLQDELGNQRRELERKVTAHFEIAKSAIESSKLRERTVKEQEADYRLGRFSLMELIRSYNAFFLSQAARARAVGDYHIALNELAGYRDELVKENKK